MLNKYKIEDTLFKMGLPADFEGFIFITDVLLMMQENSKESHWNWTKIYTLVAKKRDTQYYTVQRRIRYSLDWLRDHPQDDECYSLIENYIGYKNENTSYTLARFYRKLCRDSEEVQLTPQQMDEEQLKKIIREVIKEMLVSA